MIDKFDNLIDSFFNEFENIYIPGILSCIKEVDLLLYIDIYKLFNICNNSYKDYLEERKDKYFYLFRDKLSLLSKRIYDCIDISLTCIDKRSFLVDCDLNILGKYKYIFDKDFFDSLKEDFKDISIKDITDKWDSLDVNIQNNILSRVYRVSDMSSIESKYLKVFFTDYFFGVSNVKKE